MTLTLYLLGPVRLICPTHGDITPRSQKARGALALLGTAHGMRMSRTQLQDKLWSNSPPEQGSASLRQTLREIRTALGDARGVLIGEAGWVGLDGQHVTVELSQAYQPGQGEAEFATELDIRDPEFDNWLRDMRMQIENRPRSTSAPLIGNSSTFPALGEMQVTTAPRLPQLRIDPPSAVEPMASISASILLQEAAWRAAELLPAELVSGQPMDSPPLHHSESTPGLRLSGVASLNGGQITVLATIVDSATGQAAAMRRFSWPIEKEAEMMPLAISQLTIELISRTQAAVSMNKSFTVLDIFSFNRDTLQSAERQLQQIQNHQPSRSGTAMALRAYLRITMALENLAPNHAEILEEAAELTANARDLAPGSAKVLGISALVMYLRQKDAAARELANMAEQADPHDNFGQIAKAQVLLDSGHAADAYRSIQSMRGGLLASMAPATWMMRRAMIEVKLGKLEEAELTAAAAHAIAPSNRPSLRFLAALRFARGDEKGAFSAADSLRLLEPGFTPLLFADPQYPVSTLRAAGLVDNWVKRERNMAH